MLHMVVNRHNPESCAFRGDDEARRFAEALARLEPSDEAEASIHGSWVNRTGHELFVLVEAPNAHAVEELLIRSGLIAVGHTRTLPVIETADLQVTRPVS